MKDIDQLRQWLIKAKEEKDLALLESLRIILKKTLAEMRNSQ